MQVSEVLSAMQPSVSEYRVDLLTRQFAPAKQALAKIAGTGLVTEDVEPWFNMESAWTEVRGSGGWRDAMYRHWIIRVDSASPYVYHSRPS